MNRLIVSTLAVVAGTALTPDAPAQDRATLDLLQNASRVECRFSRLARSDWGDEGPEFTSEDADFTAAFYDIDVESGTAEAEGRFGDSYIVVRYAQGYLHFMQTQSSGPLYLTTVLAQPAEGGRLKAVHTRHEYTQVSLPGYTSRPEMYLGDCSIEAVDD